MTERSRVDTRSLARPQSSHWEESITKSTRFLERRCATGRHSRMTRMLAPEASLHFMREQLRESGASPREVRQSRATRASDSQRASLRARASSGAMRCDAMRCDAGTRTSARRPSGKLSREAIRCARRHEPTMRDLLAHERAHAPPRGVSAEVGDASGTVPRRAQRARRELELVTGRASHARSSFAIVAHCEILRPAR